MTGPRVSDPPSRNSMAPTEQSPEQPLQDSGDQSDHAPSNPPPDYPPATTRLSNGMVINTSWYGKMLGKPSAARRKLRDLLIVELAKWKSAGSLRTSLGVDEFAVGAICYGFEIAIGECQGTKRDFPLDEIVSDLINVLDDKLPEHQYVWEFEAELDEILACGDDDELGFREEVEEEALVQQNVNVQEEATSDTDEAAEGQNVATDTDLDSEYVADEDEDDVVESIEQDPALFTSLGNESSKSSPGTSTNQPQEPRRNKRPRTYIHDPEDDEPSEDLTAGPMAPPRKKPKAMD